MLDGVPLIATTIGLIGVFLYIFSTLQLSDIRANWNERRCETFVVPIAHLVPEDPRIDSTDFAVDNFYYCISYLIDASVAGKMTPMLQVFNQQVNTTIPLNESMNYLRSSATSLINPLNTMMSNLWQRIQALGLGISHSFYFLTSIFSRVTAISIAAMNAGLGIFRAVLNLLALLLKIIQELIILAVFMAIFGVLAGIFLGPLAGLAVAAVTGLAGAAIIGATAFTDYGTSSDGGFCVAKGTLVATADGWKAVELLRPGDALREGIVEGVLKTKGMGKCVSLYGVIMAECHLVFDEADKTWKPASEHPSATPCDEAQEFLYCLNTSSRTWIVKGTKEIILRDWEELPLDSSIDSEWEAAVHTILNNVKSSAKYAPRVSRPGRGLLGKETGLHEKTKGVVKVSDIRVGDFVRDGYTSFTEVLGIYEDLASTPHSGPNEAAWIWNSYTNTWTHPEHSEREPSKGSRHLITKSGIFTFFYGDGEHFIRDFTEVGAGRIDETYEFVRGLLNNSPK